MGESPTAYDPSFTKADYPELRVSGWGGNDTIYDSPWAYMMLLYRS